MPPDWAVAKDSSPLACPETKHTSGSDAYDHNSFEADPTLLASKYASIVLPAPGAVYPPPPTAAWTWSNGGIAGLGSSIVAFTDPPHGQFAAFVQSSLATGPVGFAFTRTLVGPVGRTWRISFHAAQRHNGGTADHQVVRVTVSAVTASGCRAPRCLRPRAPVPVRRSERAPRQRVLARGRRP